MYYVMLLDNFGGVSIDRDFENIKEAKQFFDKVIKDYEFGGYKSKKLSDEVTELYDNNSFCHVSLHKFEE